MYCCEQNCVLKFLRCGPNRPPPPTPPRAMVLGGEAFGRWLGLDAVRRVGPIGSVSLWETPESLCALSCSATWGRSKKMLYASQQECSPQNARAGPLTSSSLPNCNESMSVLYAPRSFLQQPEQTKTMTMRTWHWSIKWMDFRAGFDVRQILFLKPLQNDNKFLTSLFSWQNVFFHLLIWPDSKPVRSCGHCWPPILPQVPCQRRPMGVWPRVCTWTPDLLPEQLGLRGPALNGMRRECRGSVGQGSWTWPRPGSLPWVALRHLYNLPPQNSDPFPNGSQRVWLGFLLPRYQNFVGIKFFFLIFQCVEWLR